MLTRRRFLASTLAAGGGLMLADRAAAEEDRALIAVTLDLEMSRNFPTWEQTDWDYQKGNLNDETKKYAVEAARRIKAAGGVLHFFALGATLEQTNVDWLKQIVQAGHPVGNHTYDHVNVTATKPEDVQFRFRRAPWLIDGKDPRVVVRDNVRLCSAALKTRVGIDAAGFRTPGGFNKGLTDQPEVRHMLQDLGFSWVSSLYPAHKVGEPGQEPNQEVYDSIVQGQVAAQPFVYPGELIEVPMSPVSDVTAFRSGRWKLDAFLKAIRLAVEWTIDNKAVFDFLGHPSCLYVTDPEFRAVELIAELVKKAGKKAALVDLTTIAERARARQK